MRALASIVLWTLGGLVALVVLAALSLWLWPDLYGRFLRPDHAFGERPLPAPPNYQERVYWAAWPDQSSPAERLPAGIARTPPAARPADVFYLHHTTYGGTEHWVAPLDDDEVNRDTDRGPISWQASAFSGCCRIYAPRFRQATIGAYDADADTFHRAMDTAYQDVRAAFRHYLRHASRERPLILAGHSQGTFHLARLVMDEVDGTAVMARLVAVYAIGHSLTHGLLEDGYQDIALCRSPTQTGCFISWDAHEAEKAPSRWSDGDGSTWNGSSYGGFPPRQRICVNPVTWLADGEPNAPERHLGALAWQPSDADDSRASVQRTPLPGRILSGTVTASCELGERSNWLWVGGDRHADLKPSFPWSLFGRNLHGADYSLFWADIRQNAEDRVWAFVASQQQESAGGQLD